VGDAEGSYETKFPTHASRNGLPTISMWLARFHVPAVTHGESANSVSPSSLSEAELRSPRVLDGRVQLVRV